ncbi:MAG: creatininase family protein [Halobacteriaceae archaeon]
MYLHQETTTSASLGPDVVAVVPTGSVEQHGPALPLGTDLFAAEAIAATVADREEAAVLPPVPVGVSGHHRQFDGTVAVSDETFAAYVRELLESLANHGVRKAVIVNGHGGNGAALERTARRLRARETLFAVPWDWWSDLASLIEAELGTSLGHADAVETSVMLHLTEFVREAHLETAESGAPNAWGETVVGGTVAFDAADFTETGAVGTPTAGNAETGAKLVAAARDDLETLVDWLQEQPFEALRPPAHR